MGRERRRRSQNKSAKWPQTWAAKAAVKTSCATANHLQPSHKALSEDLPGQDAHSAPGTLDCDCPARPNRKTQNAQARFWFLVGFRAVLADPVLKQFYGPRRWVSGPTFGSVLWTTKLGHLFMILWPCIKEPKTMVPKMGSQNGPRKTP